MKVAIIGECMLELSHRDDSQSESRGAMSLSYGGDTLNTAVYLSRLGINVDYVTALGDDSKSDWMIECWASEGVGCQLVERVRDSVPGLYMIQTDEHGERSFLYWRDDAPVRRLFDDESHAKELFEHLYQYDWLYLTGITLALFRQSSLPRFMDFLKQYQQGSGRIVFDGNYRPRLWGDSDEARRAFEAVYHLSNVALPTLEDELLLFGDADRSEVISRLCAWGVPEVGLKMGPVGCLVVAEGSETLVKSREVPVIDTTGAGDSFNAGYLAAKLTGATAVAAAEAGHALASVVIQNRGAIISTESMPSVL